MTVALCRIYHDGVSYSYGDEVPDEVSALFPTSVGEKPISSSSIGSLTKTELQDALRRALSQE